MILQTSTSYLFTFLEKDVQNLIMNIIKGVCRNLKGVISRILLALENNVTSLLN